MLDNYVVAVRSSALDDIREMTPRIKQAMLRAVNKTADRARPAAAREIRKQVAFPTSYLAPSQGRLSISKRANGEDLTAIITGRHRPTSLARFALNARTGGRRGARVVVQPGLATFLPRAFFIPLRSGNTETNNNLGLAIRLPEGQTPSRAYKPKLIGRGLWLLYGPSIDQVFDDVAEEQAPAHADFLALEFLRLMELDS